jgi:predicted negative regulator of RcsB-dependent stress response
VVLDHLGDAYLKVNAAEKAKDAWRRAVEAFQKEKEPEKAKHVEKKMKSLLN